MTYSIDDQHGNQLTAGLQGYDLAHAAAQRRADDLGQTVYLYDPECPAPEPEAVAPRTVHCECGKCTGVRCNWVGDPAETVVVEWMPPHHRASHEAAGYAGWYPHNGALHLTVEMSCAESLVESDGEWCTIVETPESSGALTGVETDPGDGAAS